MENITLPNAESFERYLATGSVTLAPVIGVLAVILNLGKMWVIARRLRKKVISPLVYNGSLCVADLVVGSGIFVLVYLEKLGHTASKLKDGAMAEREQQDAVQFFIVRWAMISAAVHLAAMLLDKVWGAYKIVHHVTLTATKAVGVAATMLLVPAICVGGLVFGRRLLIQHGISEDVVFPFTVALVCVLFLVCAVYIYWKVKKIIIKRRREREKRTDEENEIEDGNVEEEKKFTKVTLYKVIVYFVCWTPYATVKLLKASGRSYGGRQAEYICFIFAVCSSLINPIIFIYYFYQKSGFKETTIDSKEILVKDQSSSSNDTSKAANELLSEKSDKSVSTGTIHRSRIPMT